MKQLLILSGKGGTGKTTIASAFIKLSNTKVYADCDVDAPNLHLITKQESSPTKTDYYGLEKAEINNDLCICCGKCKDSCRFGAVYEDNKYSINPYECEGCGVCEVVCPVNAISLKPSVAGELMLYKDDDSVFSTAELKMGSGTSGKLVTEVKRQLRQKDIDTDVAIIDGSPGIGCPVIASISGVNMVLIVSEPSLSGISDMKRIVDTTKIFGAKVAICVNKYDTNIENTKSIEEYCKDNHLDFVGKIPFDYDAVKQINNYKTVVDVDCEAGKAIRKVYENTMKLLLGNNKVS